MSDALKHALTAEHMSVEAYLTGESFRQHRHEYMYGSVYAMAGASRNHNIITHNLHRVFGNALLDKDCLVLGSDMKLKLNDEVFYYPDVMLGCEAEGHELYIERPCLIVEVLSRSTERHDRFEKAINYQLLPSLEAFLLVDSQSRAITIYRKSVQGWHLERCDSSEDGVLELPCGIGHIRPSDIYYKTPFAF